MKHVFRLVSAAIACVPAAPVRTVEIRAGGAGPESGHERGARWAAERCGAVAAREPHAARGEPIDVRRFRLRVAPQVPHPVVEVIDGDEEHIGAARRRFPRRAQAREGRGQHGQPAARARALRDKNTIAGYGNADHDSSRFVRR